MVPGRGKGSLYFLQQSEVQWKTVMLMEVGADVRSGRSVSLNWHLVYSAEKGGSGSYENT